MIQKRRLDLRDQQAIHDYAFTGPSGQWGRGWQNDRNAWKTYDAKSNAGTPGGLWLHFELDPSHAKDAKKVAAAFKAVLGGCSAGYLAFLLAL